MARSLLPDTSQTSYSDISQTPFQSILFILFLNCALFKNTSKYMMITHLPEGFDQAFIVFKSTFLLLLLLLKLQFRLIVLQFLPFFFSFLKKENNFSRNKGWEAEQKAAIRVLSKPQQSGNNYSHSVGGSRKTIWGKGSLSLFNMWN